MYLFVEYLRIHLLQYTYMKIYKMTMYIFFSKLLILVIFNKIMNSHENPRTSN